MTPDTLDLAQRVIERLGDRAAGRVTVRHTTNELTRFANSFIHQNVADESTRIDLSVERGGRVASGGTRVTSDAGIDALIDDLLSVADASPVSESFPGFAPAAEVPIVDHCDAGTAAATPAQRAEVVKAFVDAGDGLLAAGYCDTVTIDGAVVTTEGFAAQDVSTRATVDGIHRTGSSAGQGHQTSVRFGDLDGAAAGAQAASKARASEDAFDLKPGRYEVVLEPEAVGTVLVFLAAYGFNGRAVADGQSALELGSELFDPSVSVIDDALHPNTIGHAFDFEGTPAQRTRIIDKGVVTGHLHDRSTARAVGASATGRALPPELRWFGVMPTGAFLNAGNTSRDDMISSIERGVLVTEFNYCRVLDPRTIGMTGLTRNGTFMIENGSITGAVTNLRFTQSVMESLAPGAVLAVGSDHRLAACEFGVGLTHVPSLHLAEWNFTGGAAG